MTAPSAYDLTLAAMHLVDRMYDEGVDPAEIDAWCGNGDAAVERRRFVAKRLELELTAAQGEAARFEDLAKRIAADLDRVELGALEILRQKEQLGVEPKVKTANVNARLNHTVAIVGPEDPTLWPAAFRRVRTMETADKANAKTILKAYEDAVVAASCDDTKSVTPSPDVVELLNAGVRLDHRTSLVWK